MAHFPETICEKLVKPKPGLAELERKGRISLCRSRQGGPVQHRSRRSRNSQLYRQRVSCRCELQVLLGRNQPFNAQLAHVAGGPAGRLAFIATISPSPSEARFPLQCVRALH
jgi:hypothetical protein